MRIARRTHKKFTRFAILVLLMNGLLGLLPRVAPVYGQRRVIVVRAEQPNVWTPEQAHYLLAQMHRRNLDLRAKKLEDLDPNEINGLRFEVFKQLILDSERSLISNANENKFSQFVQQELYSSAFGKGSREFGWTFTPMPGTDRLLAGVRTTYAVVVVPEEATSLILESNGCYFPRSTYQPNDFQSTLGSEWTDGRTSRNCGDSKAFLVPIPVDPKGKNNFIVQGITYQPVDRGQRIVVSVYGYNFSSQIGVLINGSPLKQSIGLTQPFVRDDSTVGGAVLEDLAAEKVHGRIERIDSEQVVFSFEMPADYSGTALHKNSN